MELFIADFCHSEFGARVASFTLTQMPKTLLMSTRSKATGRFRQHTPVIEPLKVSDNPSGDVRAVAPADCKASYF